MSHLFHLRRNPIPPLILPTQNEIQQARHNHIPRQIPQRKAVSNDIPRSIPAPIQLRPQHGAQVADTNLHRVRHRSLGLSGHVNRRPGEGQGRGGVDAAGSEEGAGVREAGAGDGVFVSKQHDVADYGQDGGADDEDGALVQTLGDGGDGEGGEEGEGVGRDGEELGGGGAVA